jgi:hypothetical protein
VLFVYLLADEKAALQREAARHQLTLSALARARLLYGDGAPVPPPGLPPYVGTLAARLRLPDAEVAR